MNIRDYWLLKLPKVRRQSPYIGKLVENLLVNDSKVARETLVEIAKLNKPIKLQEKMSLEEKNKLEQETTSYLNNIVKELDKMIKSNNDNDLDSIIKTTRQWLIKFTYIPNHYRVENRTCERIFYGFSSIDKNNREHWIKYAKSIPSVSNRLDCMASSTVNLITIGLKTYYSNYESLHNSLIIEFIVKNLSEGIVDSISKGIYLLGIRSERFFEIIIKTIDEIIKKLSQIDDDNEYKGNSNLNWQDYKFK